METQHSSVAPPVLFCSICDKPFSKAARVLGHVARVTSRKLNATFDRDAISAFAEALRVYTITERQYLRNQRDLRLDVSLSYDLSPFTPITEIAPYSFNMNRMSSASKAYATMIIDMIRPYPQMMMRRETFPPFIHPHLTADGEDELPFPLKNCMSIAQMFFARNADTRSFVWSTIRSEMDNLVINLQTFSKHEALAALSASLMYLIMRATDSDPQDSVNDVEMVFIHQIICKRAIELAEDAFIIAEPMDSDKNWSDWIFRESCRRIIWVWFAISLVFCIQSNLPCLFAVTLQDKPLPSSKTEWEAQNESQWRTEHMLAEVRRSQLSLFIDLFDAHRTNNATKLNIWNAGIDNLGMLLNFSANMLRDR
ncbi:uncharacterized protein TRUGW13939_04730 [Talaromyces rugulosus]|uniref:Xylanolytic transcriptional activator regulatory domain-containing protein n=1 Tax=Talaromyces rugulosus TaxID=121627 RepID=A0A7H8QUC8_TALRU|nr:uncharacterized protein TRUGW13939_04730 [Talaromyces rugulosus]QKX57612.1 hypothetical protein TRUGW13939_04730 [Talaromyces rugulosus]